MAPMLAMLLTKSLTKTSHAKLEVHPCPPWRRINSVSDIAEAQAGLFIKGRGHRQVQDDI